MWGQRKQHADLTVAEYLAHMGQAVVQANIAAICTTRDIITSGELNAEIPVGAQTVHLDGVSMAPDGWIRLDTMEIECESAVHVTHGDDGEPRGLAMSMSRGLYGRGMHVKFKATFARSGSVEALEILRDAGNEALRREVAKLNITTNITREATNGTV